MYPDCPNSALAILYPGAVNHPKIELVCAQVDPTKVRWGWVKTLVPSEPQNSWDLWMFIPLKMYL
jgi:hypothetical protein